MNVVVEVFILSGLTSLVEWILAASLSLVRMLLRLQAVTDWPLVIAAAEHLFSA